MTDPALAAGGLLAGRVCIVAGAGPGLGRQSALALVRHGADVVVAARRQHSLDALVAELADRARSAGGGASRVLAVPTDITDPDQCRRLIERAEEELGGVDVLVNNAFRFDVLQPFEEVDLDAWRKITDVNVFGALQVTQAAVPAMRRRGGGSVVMVASMVARKPQPLQGGYAVSKGALLTATRVLAAELGSAGVRVNAVVPGWMLGPSVEVYVDMTASARGISREAVLAELARPMPLGRVPTDAEVAGTVVYLASDLSAAVTGQAVDANGGELFV